MVKKCARKNVRLVTCMFMKKTGFINVFFHSFFLTKNWFFSRLVSVVSGVLKLAQMKKRSVTRSGSSVGLSCTKNQGKKVKTERRVPFAKAWVSTFLRTMKKKKTRSEFYVENKESASRSCR